MMRLNPAPRKNLREGQRVQSDINGDPEAVYIVRSLYEYPLASGGFAALVTTESGRSVTASATAACWFWPEGILAAVPESPEYIKRIEAELDAARKALTETRAMNARQYRRLTAIRAAVTADDK